MIDMMVWLIFSSNNMHGVVDFNSNSYRNMVIRMRVNRGGACECSIVDEEPNADVAEFFLSFKRFW